MPDYQIRPKRSVTPGVIPTAQQLASFELAINVADGKIFVKDASSIRNLSPITFFSTKSKYAQNDLVVNQSKIWKAKVAMNPGSWVAANWQPITDEATTIDLSASHSNASVSIAATGGGSAATINFATTTQAGVMSNLQVARLNDTVVKTPAGQALQTIKSPVTVQGDFRAVGAITATENIESAKDIVAFSDKRLKTNLEPITDALARVGQITAYMYDRIDNEKHMAGVIAQDVQTVLPEAVHESEKGYLAVSTPQLLALVLQAVNELAQKVAALEA